MKNNRALAKKYAAALLALAKETGTLEEVEQELAQIGEIVQQNPELTDFLRNQLISREAKKEVVERIFTQHLNPMVMRVLSLTAAELRSCRILLMSIWSCRMSNATLPKRRCVWRWT